MKRTRYQTKSPAETKRLAASLAKKIRVLALKGDLGSGKTTFVQGLAAAAGIQGKILSPTFVIFRRFNNFYHFDCYRIKDSEELLRLGFLQIISNPQILVAIEWAEKVKNILPPETVWVFFKFINETTREIMIKYPNVREKKDIIDY